MRYQEQVYIKNNVSGLRNKTYKQPITSSDICFFKAPNFTISGATKIVCPSINNQIYVFDEENNEIELYFSFNGNYNTFLELNPDFNFKLFPLLNNTFSSIASFSSQTINENDLINSGFTFTINTNDLIFDNEYLIKGFYSLDYCTEYMSKIGRKLDLNRIINGSEYGIYNKETDYYFTLLKKAAKPEFDFDNGNTLPSSSLIQVEIPINYTIIYPELNSLDNIDLENLSNSLNIDNTKISLPVNVDDSYIITLNGLVLSKNSDYKEIGNSIIEFKEPLNVDDIVTVIFTQNSSNTLHTDTYFIDKPIVSGITDNQNENEIYYNETTQKYEIYSKLEPLNFSNVLIMINGVMLANGVDFYQSISNPKRIILNGEIVINDLINISYFPKGLVGNIYNNNPTISWTISPNPKNTNGVFTLELSTNKSFTNIVNQITKNYIINQSFYTLNLPINNFNKGDVLYYRVKNEKFYTTICGEVISSVNYSDIIPITIASNNINSY